MALSASQARVTAQIGKPKKPQLRSRSSSLSSLSYQSEKPPNRRKASASSVGSSETCEDSGSHIPRVSSDNTLPNSNSLDSPNGRLPFFDGRESVTWLTPLSSTSSSPTRFNHSGTSERPHHTTPVRQLYNTELTCVNELSRSPSPAEDIASIMDNNSEDIMTSTPKDHLSVPRPQRPLTLSPPTFDDDTAITHDFTTSHRTNETMLSVDIMAEDDMMNVPIIGYEVMEERSRFTVYKIHVHKTKDENWFIFRRYSDFVRLNDQLVELFPHFRLALPPKKWFGDNFDNEFLEDRMKGLRAFLRNVTSHREVACSEPIRTFLCLDDPPGPHESIEESRAQCDQLEEQLYDMKRENKEKDARIALLEEELALHKAEIENLRKSLRLERALNASRLRERKSPSQSSQRSECSLPEQDQTALETEADQVMTSSTDSHCNGLVSEMANHILHRAMVHTSSEDIPNGQVVTGLPEKLASMEGNNNSQLHSPEGSMSSNEFSKSSLAGSHSPSTAVS